MSNQSQISVATLVAIILAAHKSGDRQLERSAIKELIDEHGVRLSFVRQPKKQEAANA